jgi:hypothetical protein
MTDSDVDRTATTAPSPPLPDGGLPLAIEVRVPIRFRDGHTLDVVACAESDIPAAQARGCNHVRNHVAVRRDGVTAFWRAHCR